MKIIFAGTPDFAATALNAIHQAGFQVDMVLTQPDRPKGRGMQLAQSPVKQTALALNLPIMQPEKLRNNPEALATLSALQADVMVVAAYGLILPETVLNLPKHGCLNIHASLLPRWRGAAPIQRAIEAGDKETGICIMQMDMGLDTGAIISEHRYPIRDTDTAQEVHDALMQLGAKAIVEDLQRLAYSGSLKSQAQPENGVTYAQKLNKEEAKIQWQENAEIVARKIRAFNPIPVAWTEHQGKPMKIWSAKMVKQQGKPGEILALDNNGIIVACGQNAICITELQPSGKKRMTVAAFLSGHAIRIGDTFS